MLAPDQELPHHEEPHQELPHHDEPHHELPHHDEPHHELPHHDEPSAAGVRSLTSPVASPLLASRTVPLASSSRIPTVPRLAASEPVPSDGSTPTFALPAPALSAA